MDQFRQGEFVPIYDSGDSRSACALIRAVLAAVGSAGSHLPIFRKVGTGSKKGTYLRTQALSYGRVRELVTRVRFVSSVCQSYTYNKS